MNQSKPCKKACILGVGLLGGSVAKALKSRGLVEQVVGWGRNAERLDAAKQLGVIDQVSTSLERAAEGCDLVLAATPVQQIVPTLNLASKVTDKDCLFLDVGSTKNAIAVESEEYDFATAFCPSHPIAGSEKSGAENATADLFVGRCTVLTPTARTSAQALTRAREFWESLGSRVVEMTPADHDAALAATSHVPHLVASVLSASTPKELLALVGSGWSDATRVAAGDPELWRQIVEENLPSVLAAMDQFSQRWIKLCETLQRKDFDQLSTILAEGKSIRDAYRKDR